MPRISAPSVKEHNERVLEALTDAAEELLREDPGKPLTAGAVAARAGIARNSIYRHVASVDDLRDLVVSRHVPAWQAAIDDALEGHTKPSDRILAWCHANLWQSSRAGHGWLRDLSRTAHAGPAAQRSSIDQAHSGLEGRLATEWTTVVGHHAPLYAELTRSLVDAGMRRLDAGDDFALVARLVEASVRTLLEAGAQGDDTEGVVRSAPAPGAGAA